ncbi:hypothetical protein [Sorangium sp. So ce388]|uniref:hypothetical protein n=1 Tax=Sorangium sp. So ce388 TaxID=3133309 RepID=UPI003F5AEDCA
MSISPRRLLLPSSLVLVIVSSYPGCGDENYIGGQCEDPQDCQSPTQYLEGGTCRDNQCVCADAAHHICCDAGDTREDCYQRCLPCELCRDRPPTCPPHCGNSVTDRTLGETARDCGGPCGRCDLGERCASGADCNTGVCEMGVCKAPTCGDGVKNDSESGVDCGAPSCPLCPAGEGCRSGEDCASGVCWAGACEAPSCTDGIRNGGEKDIDCGGACPACR